MIVIQFFVNNCLSVYRMFRHSQSSLETLQGLFEEYIRMVSTCEGLGTGPGERFPCARFNDGDKDWAKRGGKT